MADLEFDPCQGEPLDGGRRIRLRIVFWYVGKRAEGIVVEVYRRLHRSRPGTVEFRLKQDPVCAWIAAGKPMPDIGQNVIPRNVHIGVHHKPGAFGCIVSLKF